MKPSPTPKRLKTAALAALSGLWLAQAAAADIEKRNIKLPIVNTIDHPQGIGAQKFADLVAEKSEGKITVKVFPGGTLGGETQMVSSLQGGVIEATMMAPAILVGAIKEFIILDFPFVFEKAEEADHVLDGPVGQSLLDLLPDKGLVGLAYMEQGYRSISNNRRAITKLEDIEGLKLRTLQNPLYIDMLSALGANPVPMPFPELYTALETGTVDGQENPPLTIEASKLFEVQKFFSLDKHIYNPQMILISKKFWDELSDDEKALLQEAAYEARDYQRQVAREMSDKSIETLEANGMEVNEVAAEEIARMRERVQPVIDKYSAEVGADLVTGFYAELENARKAQ